MWFVIAACMSSAGVCHHPSEIVGAGDRSRPGRRATLRWSSLASDGGTGEAAYSFKCDAQMMLEWFMQNAVALSVAVVTGLTIFAVNRNDVKT